MGSIHHIWLCFALLPCLLFVGSYSKELQSEACRTSALGINDSKKNATSQLSQSYSVDNLVPNQTKPWIGNFTYEALPDQEASKTLAVEFDFKHAIQLPYITMKGGSVSNLYADQKNTEKCYVTRFVMEYKTSDTSTWIKHTHLGRSTYMKFDSNTGDYDNEPTNIIVPITALKIWIRKWHNCPAVFLDLHACGVCPNLSHEPKKSLHCSHYNETCTYTCMMGYLAAEKTKTCYLDGRWRGNDLSCQDKDECRADVCHTNAVCKNTQGSYECKCNPGYQGDGQTCTDVDECRVYSNPCPVTNANCVNTPGSYQCRCDTGYSGDGYKYCTDKDECAADGYCHKYAICKNSPGSYDCQCNTGFKGDGLSCTDIDECAVDNGDCPSNAHCSNTQGSFKCECYNGYQEHGKLCTDTDECLDANICSGHGNCTNEAGDFSCVCEEGYSGKTCNTGTKPTIRKHSPLKRTVRFGETVKFFCEATGAPLPGILWYNEQGRKYPTEGIVGSMGKSTFTITNVALNNTGRYACIASNYIAGKYETHIKYMEIVVDGSPWPPKFTTNVTHDTVVISTGKSNPGASAINKYLIWMSNGSKNSSQEEHDSASTFTWSDLKPNTVYEVWIVAFNNHGNTASEKKNITTDVPRPAVLPKPLKGEIQSSSTDVMIRLSTMEDDSFLVRIQIIVFQKVSRTKREAVTHLNDFYAYEIAQEKGKNYYITGEVGTANESFIVGDGKRHGGYLNKKLEPGKSYAIYVRGVSYNRQKEARYGELSEPLDVAIPKATSSGSGDDGKSVLGIAIGISVFVLVLIILVILALYIRSRSPKTVEIDPETGKKKRRKRSFNSELLPLTKKVTGKRKSSTVEDGSPDPNHPPVPVSGFAKHVAKLHKSDDRGFMIQYNTLESSPIYTSAIASLAENKDKNRYANIIAYDASRVELKKIGDDEHSDYINASFVDGYNMTDAYIATQGPLENTFNDFWRMVWEHRCPAIIMLTNLQERHKIKCHKYWPDESETYGGITVTATRREQYADYVIRTFHLKMNETEEERQMKQFHFTVWPDHGVPEYPTAILAFQRRLRAYCSRECGKLIVHCSAGVGRSGTFIVIDSMLARIQHAQTIDIYNYVRYIRTRRMYMVQTEEQYVFCHDALLESILCGNTQIAAHNIRIEMNKLKTKDETSMVTGFEKEFKTLAKVSPSLPKECFVVASYPESIPKNRYPDILASDHGRVTLSSPDENVASTYINAVFVDGYKQQNAFILTQIPLTPTINDFWRMLYEKRSACVLLLSDLTEEGDFPQFWPENEGTEYGSIKVEVASDTAKNDCSGEDQFIQDKLSDDIVERKFKLTKEEGKPLVVKMFQHLSWKEHAVPPDISAIVSLIQRIEKWQQRSGNGPITAMCNDGLGRSGTFATLSSVLERVKTEQVIDVFQTIKALRIQRPGLVKDADQYEFIHLGVQEYLDSFSDYSNFK